MKTATYGLVLILFSGLCHCQFKDGCIVEHNLAADRYFPDIRKIAPIAYQMELEYTIINENMTDYFVEYYDVFEKRGRVDYLIEGSETNKYYYYSDGLEAFEIAETAFTCRELNISNNPDFKRFGSYDWFYDGNNEIIRGPSAMFRIAYEEDQKDHSKLMYMGESKDIRGIPAEYWRRCLRKNLTIDYFFSVGNREGVYGLKDLTSIPLRIVIYGVDDEFPELSKELFPQNYDFMSYTPYLDDPFYTFELPVGMGCGRKPREDDDRIPDFQQKSLFISAEAVYTDYETGTSYISDFIFAYDIDSAYLSYFYTPWIANSGKVEPGFPTYVVYDTKNKYLFNTSYADGSCQIGNLRLYTPSYYLPGGNKGYITLTDPTVFYPDNEFFYLGEGIDRGYKVNIFEVAYPDGYLLGDRSVKNTVVTHYYLKSDEYKEGPRSVEKAMTRIRMSFNGTDESGKKTEGVLNFNFYDFSTNTKQKSTTFYIEHCMRDEDDVMFVTVGFSAEEAQMDLISQDIPSVVENARTFLTEVVDIPPARVPRVMVDFSNVLDVTFVILQKPTFQLDFDEPKAKTTIDGATETKGVTFLQDCAQMCLEGDYDCWGFAHCGATCYIGAGDRKAASLTAKANCTYFNRTNFNIVPSLKTIRKALERAAETKRPVMSVAKKGGGIVDFKPKYIQDAVFGDSSGIFDLLNVETSPRLKIVKIGAKLKSGAGEDAGKNFGRLTYAECQRFCLDYKACETVSYCLSTGECILSLSQAEDIDKTKFEDDSFCNVLSRKYIDAFIRSPGEVLSQTAKSLIEDAKDEEDCARYCIKESSFACLSFDSCQVEGGKKSCRLHAVHTLDVKSNETAVTSKTICGHYSKKYTFDFKREPKKKTVGSGLLLAREVSVEQCAKYCVDYNQGECTSFDACLTGSMQVSCTVFTQNTNQIKTDNNDVCDHFERPMNATFPKPVPKKTISLGVAGGVGFLIFVISCILGAAIVYGVAYFRVNKRQ